jgi:hypothetical protein
VKKQLLATTALVAVGLVGATGTANANMKLGIGGFQEIIVGVADQDDAVRNSTDYDTQFDGEIHFKASQTLDNGLKLRTRVELESKTESDQIDEAYIDVSGKWGAIRVGSEDNAAHLMVTPTMGSWATNVGQNTNFDVTDWIILPKDHQGKVTSRLELGEGDAEKITYFSPRVGGVQVGVSYMPSGEEDKNSSIAPTDVDIVHGWAAATNYRGKFGGTSIGLAAGYAQAKQPSGQSGGKVAGFFPEGDPKGWSVSGKVSFAGVTLAAGYMNRMNLGSGDGISKGGNALDLGAKYDFGKNHVSVGYVYNEAEASYAISGDDESTRLMASYRRDLGKGIQYRLNFIYGDFEGEAAGNADDNEGVAVTTGVRIAF